MTTDAGPTAASLPPGPSSWTAWRLGLAFSRDPLRLFLDMARQYGDVAHARLGPWHFVLLSQPEPIEEVMVKHPRDFTKEKGPARQIIGNGLLVSDGPFHMRQRRMLQPAFHRDRLALYGKVMADFSVRRRDRWQAGQQLNVHHEMMELAQMIVAKTLFDSDVEAEADALGQAISTALHVNFLAQHLPFAGLWKKLRRHSAHQEAIATINDLIYRMIAEHRQGGTDRGDLLSMLLEAQDTEGGTGGLTDEQVRDELATLFVAGHETSANALAWAWYLLARHPEVESAVHAEIDQVLAGRPPTVADVPKLPYTEMVVAETLRLYPPVWAFLRTAVIDTVVGGHHIPAGAFVFISTYGVHHDARFFPDPERFDPQRMARAARAARSHFEYLPFGAGSRQCMGESFAWLEMILVIAAIAQRWRLRLPPGKTIAPSAGLTLRPAEEMLMTVEARA